MQLERERSVAHHNISVVSLKCKLAVARHFLGDIETWHCLCGYPNNNSRLIQSCSVARHHNGVINFVYFQSHGSVDIVKFNQTQTMRNEIENANHTINSSYLNENPISASNTNSRCSMLRTKSLQRQRTTCGGIHFTTRRGRNWTAAINFRSSLFLKPALIF